MADAKATSIVDSRSLGVYYRNIFALTLVNLCVCAFSLYLEQCGRSVLSSSLFLVCPFNYFSSFTFSFIIFFMYFFLFTSFIIFNFIIRFFYLFYFFFLIFKVFQFQFYSAENEIVIFLYEIDFAFFYLISLLMNRA